jgi:hypothetical protein
VGDISFAGQDDRLHRERFRALAFPQPLVKT